MKRIALYLLITIALFQVLIFLYLLKINSRGWSDFQDYLKNYNLEQPKIVIEKSMEYKELYGHNITPGFISGYIKGRYNRSVPIIVSYNSKRNEWLLLAVDENCKIRVTDHDIRSASILLLEEYREKCK